MSINVGGFTGAQAAYDRAEPPDEKPCPACDNTGKVEVATYRRANGEEMGLDDIEIDCPECGRKEEKHDD